MAKKDPKLDIMMEVQYYGDQRLNSAGKSIMGKHGDAEKDRKRAIKSYRKIAKMLNRL